MDLDTLLASLANEYRWYVFIGAFGVIALWESFQPRRRLTASTPRRWLINIALTFGNTILLRLSLPLFAIGVATLAQQQGWGLLNLVQLPAWLAFVLAFLALDITRYVQHLALHHVPALWRLHRIHHADVDYDCTTGLRFHPLEAFFSEAVLFGAIIILGAAPFTVMTFELVYLVIAFFSHGNIGFPKIDYYVRLFLVTPDMHRVHHSVEMAETNSNFGGLFPWWDRLFGTYRAQPAAGHTGMMIGLQEYRDPGELTFTRLLALPFLTRRTRSGVATPLE
ncbi:MAG: sterol desaturase family protein [Gammaproteobacteria bacterium]|jgi:sterol desaturase/sphingolipid hydroxylase (fatty acid hydroxylase superfamily)